MLQGCSRRVRWQHGIRGKVGQAAVKLECGVQGEVSKGGQRPIMPGRVRAADFVEHT